MARRSRRLGAGKPVDLSAADDLLDQIRRKRTAATNYRERSLQRHGLVCARCARQFSEKDRHLLTVHHKDGNHDNNPADGSNWENLCVYCHEDEHSRRLLGDYYSEGED
jgi:5-methylcytosine-specific restriction endonuclease McrA